MAAVPPPRFKLVQESMVLNYSQNMATRDLALHFAEQFKASTFAKSLPFEPSEADWNYFAYSLSYAFLGTYEDVSAGAARNLVNFLEHCPEHLQKEVESDVLWSCLRPGNSVGCREIGVRPSNEEERKQHSICEAASVPLTRESLERDRKFLDFLGKPRYTEAFLALHMHAAEDALCDGIIDWEGFGDTMHVIYPTE
ncbi:hypothetical protein HDV00_007431 [Rhizophlyctis rosea]|nr:hypothetical protein HDV00_007431 [Rhizophlyctis rosea]